jgi:threonine dehydratase
MLPTFEDVAAAAERLTGYSHRTPVLTSRTVDEAIGARVFFKCENFQRTGAFKFRGAFNSLSCFDEKQRRAGAVAFSGAIMLRALLSRRECWVSPPQS